MHLRHPVMPFQVWGGNYLLTWLDVSGVTCKRTPCLQKSSIEKGLFSKTDYHLLSLCWSDWMYQVSFARKPNFCKNLNIKSDSLRKRRDDLFTFFLTCSNASGVFCKKAQLWQKCQTCTEGINRKRALSQKSRDHLLRLWWRDWIRGVSFAKGPNICKGAQ